MSGEAPHMARGNQSSGQRFNLHPSMGRPRPDHFIGVRIRSEGLDQVRADIRKLSPGIEGYEEEGCRAHVTLGVLRLDTEEKVERCVVHFQRAASKLREGNHFPAEGFRVSFDGIGMFGSRVLFLNPSKSSVMKLTDMRACLFDEHVSEFATEDKGREYKPHLTIAKQTRRTSKRGKTGSVATRMPEDASVFGDVRVDVKASVTTVELVRMGSDKEEDGVRPLH